jgi:hypothetical protein
MSHIELQILRSQWVAWVWPVEVIPWQFNSRGQERRVVHDRIELIPEIPLRLRIAAKEGKLVPFVGAGLSQLAGCPGWNDFSTAALSFLVGQGNLDHGHLELLSKLSCRVKLSIARRLERQNGTTIDYSKLLMPAVLLPEGARAYRALSQLGRTFVTTNYDDLLDRQYPSASGAAIPSRLPTPVAAPSVVYKLEEITLSCLGPPDHKVIHIHGSIKEPSSMVLTTADYLERYAGHRLYGHDRWENPYLTFLEELFRQKNLLFIGYGLEELEILEYVLQKTCQRNGAAADEAKKEEPRHYLLQGFFQHEAPLLRELRAYYLEECGIGLLPYSREQRNWHQLVDILEHFSREISVGPLPPLAKRQEMEDLLR